MATKVELPSRKKGKHQKQIWVPKRKTQETFVLAYPFFFNNRLMGDIVYFFEKEKLKLKGMRLMHVNEKFIENHFKNVGGEPQGEHPRLSWVSYITNRPVIAMIWEGHDAVRRVHEKTSTQEESLFWFDDG
ncbi:hypothetical protein MKW94_026532 [Papaver nudicaule]|uniref:nucleoside-diphosphate kinase n=1 Tax=Papaver nudicaule TaxID=74823 RepID=A0AA41RYV1_PAPNU|nr:hypothetical protein [Papaver nudicaule]